MSYAYDGAGNRVFLVLLKKPTVADMAMMEKWAKQFTVKIDDKNLIFSSI